MTSTSGADEFWRTLDEIKSRGFWRVHMFPVARAAKRFDGVAVLKALVRKVAVEYRGWDYPHVPDGRTDIQGWYFVENRLEAWVRYGSEVEAWRLYETGQFIHYFAVGEDWMAEDAWAARRDTKPGEVLDAIEVALKLSEIYSFVAKLASEVGPDLDFTLERSLSDMKGRQLVLLAPGRMPLRDRYRCFVPEIHLPDRRAHAETFVQRFREFAIEDAVEIYHQFNWEHPNVAIATDSQTRMFERRL